VGKARVAESGELPPDIQDYNGRGNGPLADHFPDLRHPFPTNLSLPESPKTRRISKHVDAESGNRQSTPNNKKPPQQLL
jgi:hypothetical protein